MAKPVFKGDEQITEAKSYLKSSIDSYNNALVNINLSIVVKVYELLKGTGTYQKLTLRGRLPPHPNALKWS